MQEELTIDVTTGSSVGDPAVFNVSVSCDESLGTSSSEASRASSASDAHCKFR